MKRRHRIFVIILAAIILTLFSASAVFATPGSDYNKERYITINLNGGSASMKWIFQYDRDPPNSSRKAGVFYDGVATGKVYDKFGNVHTLGLKRYEEKRDPPLDKYPFYDNENPKNGKFKQHMDFVGQTPWVWISTPTRTGYTFDGWTISPSRTTKSHNNGTAIHAGLSGGDFTITANWKDDIAPSGSFSPNSRDWGNSNVSVTISGSDSGSGVKRIRYRTETNGSWGSWSGWTSGSSRSVTLSSNGSYRLQAEIEDNAGNTKTITSGYYRIDKTQPSVSFSPNSRDWGNSNVSVSISMSDSGGSGFKQHRYRTETNGSWGSWSSWSTSSSRSISFSSNGSYRIQVEAQDNAGNTRSATSEYYRVDKSAPSITANPTGRSWANTNVTVTLTFSDSHSQISTKQYAWSTSTSTPSSWSTYSSAVTQSNNGSWYLHARAVDKAGNITTRYFGPYQIDKTAASHVSHSLTGYRYKDGNDYWIRANDTVKYKMRGSDTLSGIRYSYARLLASGIDVRSQHDWNGAADHNNQFMTSNQIAITGAARTYNSGGQREIEWTIQAREYENDFDVQYYYTDVASNTVGYNSTGMRIRIDTTKPSVVISRQNGDLPLSESLVLTVAEAKSGLKTVKYSWSASSSTPSSWIDASNQIKNKEAVVEIVPASPGLMYLHYYAEDNVGNVITGYAGQYNVYDDSISLDGLALVKVTNPPHGTQVPVVYPVDNPPAVNAGYKLDFAMMVTGADEADIKLYNKSGERVPMYTSSGAVETLTILIPNHDQNTVKFTFWLDKEMEEGTILDMEIILRRSLLGGRTTMIGSDSLGKNALQIVGSSKKDWRINLTK